MRFFICRRKLGYWSAVDKHLSKSDVSWGREMGFWYELLAVGNCICCPRNRFSVDGLICAYMHTVNILCCMIADMRQRISTVYSAKSKSLFARHYTFANRNCSVATWHIYFFGRNDCFRWAQIPILWYLGTNLLDCTPLHSTCKIQTFRP